MQRLKSCLLLLLIAVGVGFFLFKTDVGWMCFYSFGRFPDDLRAAVEPQGLSLKGARFGMFQGSRLGWCRFRAERGDVEAWAARARAAGMAVAEHLDADDRATLDGVGAGSAGDLATTWISPALDRAERAAKAQRLAQGKARVWEVKQPVGRLDGLHLYYDLETGEALLVSGYPYG